MTIDKKQQLKAVAHEIFSQKGYKATGISEITKRAGVAAGTFYNYYAAKEDIFLDVYIDENNRVRQIIMDDINWQGELPEVVGQLFGKSRSLISTSKIMSEWYNPAVSDLLHSYYDSEKGRADNTFHQFLLITFTKRMQEEGFTAEKIQEVFQVYQLFYYMDMHITEQDFPNISQTIETLATYFVKGLLK